MEPVNLLSFRGVSPHRLGGEGEADVRLRVEVLRQCSGGATWIEPFLEVG